MGALVHDRPRVAATVLRRGREVRAVRHPLGGLVVGVRGAGGEWHRVDEDLPRLVRLTIAMLTHDRERARRFLDGAARLAGTRPADPAEPTALLRIAYPLLSPVQGFPAPGAPAAFPAELSSALRRARPREAAAELFGRGCATRPVARSLARLLCATPDADAMGLCVLAAAAPVLGPDRLHRVLDATADRLESAAPPVVRGALDQRARQALRRVMDGVSAPRAERLLIDALGDDDERRRLRYVVTRRALPEPGRRWTWRTSTLLAVCGDTRVAAVNPPAPHGPTEPRGRYTLRPARSQATLDRLAADLDNCLHGYGWALQDGEDRIIEVLEGDRPRFAVHVRRGRVIEFRGFRNARPSTLEATEVRRQLQREGYLADVRGPERYRGSRWSPAAGYRLQAMAQDLLAPPHPHQVRWPELAAALWARGLVRDLPDPADAPAEIAVRDLAALALSGDLPDGQLRPEHERWAANALLLDRVEPHTQRGWDLQDAAAALIADVQP